MLLVILNLNYNIINYVYRAEYKESCNEHLTFRAPYRRGYIIHIKIALIIEPSKYMYALHRRGNPMHKHIIVRSYKNSKFNLFACFNVRI